MYWSRPCRTDLAAEMSNNIEAVSQSFSGNGLYVHVPFCLAKCDYCGFYSQAPQPSSIVRYLEHLALEAKARTALFSADFTTVFVGGGNPTCIGLENLKRLVEVVLTCLPDINTLQEWTFETNPETLTPEIVSFLTSLPAIRLSIGIQRLHQRELSVLGRRASIEALFPALELAFAKVRNVSCDFIMGVPGCSSLADDLHDLMVRYPFTHVSAYFLTVEEDTPLQRSVQAGNLSDPADIGAEELYEVRDVLVKAGFEHYEISNYARPGFRCQHNINYWRQGSYTGLGPAAVSSEAGTRLANVADLDRWLAGEKPAVEKLSQIDQRNEHLMLRLRLLQDGLDIARFVDRYGRQSDEFYATLSHQIETGNLCRGGDRLRLSDSGLRVADEVMASLFI